MFKKILVVASVSLSTSVFAQSVTVNAGIQTTDSNGVNSSVSGISVRTKVFEQTHLDIGIGMTRATNTHSLTNRYEIGLTPNFSVSNSNLSFSVRGALGQKAVSTKAPHNYYSVEPAVSANLGDFSVRVGYRWRDVFNNSYADKSQTTRLGISYGLTKNDRVGIGYDVQRGDGASKTTAVSYTRNF